MSMKAHLRTDAHGNITIIMEGDLNYENTEPLKKELEDISRENPNSRITLDMQRLDFVGSSGISLFVDTIKIINAQKDQIRLSNIKSEFKKVFQLYNLDLPSVIEDEFGHDDATFMAKRFGGKNRTFEN